MDNQEEEIKKKNGSKKKKSNGFHRVHEYYQKKEQLWNMGTDQWQQTNKTKKCKLKCFLRLWFRAS